MEPDDLAEKQAADMHVAWHNTLRDKGPALPLRLAAQHCPGPAKPVKVSSYLAGGFNYCWIVTFDNGDKVVCRFPILGQTWFRNEQTDNTISTIKHLKSIRTAIPMPRVLGSGKCEAGPYAIYEHVDGVDLGRCLNNPDNPEYTELKPGITDQELFRAYKSMADILLEMYRRDYPRGGALGCVPRATGAGAWEVCRRPLTFTVNELVRAGGVPENLLPDKSQSFNTTAEFFVFLADLQFLNLKHQRNKAITGDWDCRKKYVARCLFRVLVKRLCNHKSPETFKFSRGPFRLHCDDFRPTNVIVKSKDDFTVTGVIDWDFTYAAPPEFAEAAPWWLLLDTPLYYENDLGEFLDLYKPKLKLFLQAMRECEDKRFIEGRLHGARLSDKMQASMKNGMFWLCYAMRNHLMFDVIYWKFLDRKFFGEFTSLDDRIAKFLPREDRDGMEEFVQMKMRQMRAPEKQTKDLLPKDQFIAL